MVMTTPAAVTWNEADVTERGWYLYGITLSEPLAPVLAAADAGHPLGAGVADDMADAARLQLLDCSGLVAVVRPVPLADFSQAVLQDRLRSASDLEAIVRNHNHVIETIHARQAILPAKFGSVYARAEDLVAALRSSCDVLMPRLRRVDGCDEWAVHVYADRVLIRERICTENHSILRLRDECSKATPGRAYFLQQQLRSDLRAATDDALGALAKSVFDRLAGHAVAAQTNAVGPIDDAADETEILRASFLVTREVVERFEEQVRASDTWDGVRSEATGPWPPYSFAVPHDEVTA